MARGVKLASELNELVEGQEPLIEGEQEDETELDILNEMNASPGDVTWWFRVSRVLGSARNGVTEPRLFEGDATVMKGLADRLRDDHGSGKYRVRVLRNNRLYRRFDMDIEAPAKPVQPERSSEMATVLTAFQQQAERTNQLLERLLTPPQNPFSQVPAVPQNPFQGIKEIAGVMTELRAMMQPASSPVEATMNAFIKGVEVAKGLSPENDSGETNIMDIIKEAVRGAMPVLIDQARQSGVQVPQSSQEVKPLPSPQTQQSTPQAPDANAQMVQEVRQTILYLCGKAQQNADQELYAEWILDNWPRERIVGILGQTNAIPLLLQIVPEAQPFLPWFQKLIAEIKEILQDEAEAPMPVGSSGVSSNASPVSNFGNPGRHSGGGSDFEDDDRFGA